MTEHAVLIREKRSESKVRSIKSMFFYLQRSEGRTVSEKKKIFKIRRIHQKDKGKRCIFTKEEAEKEVIVIPLYK